MTRIGAAQASATVSAASARRDVLAALGRFYEDRLRYLLELRGLAYDEIEAAPRRHGESAGEPAVAGASGARPARRARRAGSSSRWCCPPSASPTSCAKSTPVRFRRAGRPQARLSGGASLLAVRRSSKPSSRRRRAPATSLSRCAAIERFAAPWTSSSSRCW